MPLAQVVPSCSNASKDDDVCWDETCCIQASFGKDGDLPILKPSRISQYVGIRPVNSGARIAQCKTIHGNSLRSRSIMKTIDYQIDYRSPVVDNGSQMAFVAL